MICPSCGKLIGVGEERCPFCGGFVLDVDRCRGVVMGVIARRATPRPEPRP